jgi:flap endonuclease-1
MGIKDLTKFLRDKKINCFVQNYPLSNLSGYRIGIDANNFLFVQGAGLHKDAVFKTVDVIDEGVDREVLLQKLYLRVLNNLIIFMNNGITPILVFDGTAEIEKTTEREKRKEDRIKRNNKIKEYQDEMNKIPIHLRNVKNLGNVPKDLWEQAIRYTELEKEVKKLMSTQVSVFRDEIDAVKILLSSLGIPCITAEAEGEMFCAEMAVGLQTAATYSTDSDCLALGVQFYFDSITGSKKGHGGFISGTTLGPILETLELSMDEFRDFCILLGTDFNERIPGYGPAKGYALIKECRTIENIQEKKGLDITKLNHIRTRELITPKQRDWSQYKLDIDFDKFSKNGEIILNQYGLSAIYGNLFEAVENVKSVRC